MDVYQLTALLLKPFLSWFRDAYELRLASYVPLHALWYLKTMATWSVPGLQYANQKWQNMWCIRGCSNVQNTWFSFLLLPTQPCSQIPHFENMQAVTDETCPQYMLRLNLQPRPFQSQPPCLEMGRLDSRLLKDNSPFWNWLGGHWST